MDKISGKKHNLKNPHAQSCSRRGDVKTTTRSHADGSKRRRSHFETEIRGRSLEIIHLQEHWKKYSMDMKKELSENFM